MQVAAENVIMLTEKGLIKALIGCYTASHWNIKPWSCDRNAQCFSTRHRTHRIENAPHRKL